MGEQINSSSKTILELIKNINNCMKEIRSLNTEMNNQLKKLGNSFQDEGYILVQSYINYSNQKYLEAAPDFKTVMEKLFEYATLLEESEKNIK